MARPFDAFFARFSVIVIICVGTNRILPRLFAGVLSTTVIDSVRLRVFLASLARLSEMVIDSITLAIFAWNCVIVLATASVIARVSERNRPLPVSLVGVPVNVIESLAVRFLAVVRVIESLIAKVSLRNLVICFAPWPTV